MFELPEQVSFALNELTNAGFEAYIVGGSVRDALMGEVPCDYDITTSATPEETKAVFLKEKVIETGLKHGTVTVIIKGMPLEITTFRIDADYSDNRHPDKVQFTRTLKEDLARRDFTVNALAFSEKTGLVDCFSGKTDLENKIIRCVGDADKRFNEDALRIMRALRFSAVLGFEIEKETKKAIHKNKELLKKVSSERIAAELLKLICGKDAKNIILNYAEVLCVVLPEISDMIGFDQRNPHHIYDVLTHSAVAVENIPPLPHLRLAALLHDCGKPATFTVDDAGVGHFYGHAEISHIKAEAALNRLKLDNATKNRVLTLIKYHDVQILPTEKSVKRALNKLSPEVFFDLLELKKADNLAQSPEYRERLAICNELKNQAEKILSQKQCFSLKDLAVNGSDLINLGFKPGKRLGDALDGLLNAVIEDEVKNEKAALTEYLNKISAAKSLHSDKTKDN